MKKYIPSLPNISLAVSAALVAAALVSACGGADEYDPDFDGPEYEGECIEDPKAREDLARQAREKGWPVPPFEEVCAAQGR